MRVDTATQKEENESRQEGKREEADGVIRKPGNIEMASSRSHLKRRKSHQVGAEEARGTRDAEQHQTRAPPKPLGENGQNSPESEREEQSGPPGHQELPREPPERSRRRRHVCLLGEMYHEEERTVQGQGRRGRDACQLRTARARTCTGVDDDAWWEGRRATTRRVTPGVCTR